MNTLSSNQGHNGTPRKVQKFPCNTGIAPIYVYKSVTYKLQAFMIQITSQEFMLHVQLSFLS
jgi:hypothetical protein